MSSARPKRKATTVKTYREIDSETEEGVGAGSDYEEKDDDNPGDHDVPTRDQKSRKRAASKTEANKKPKKRAKLAEGILIKSTDQSAACKSKKATKRGYRGKLAAALSAVPVEVIDEIVKYLDPNTVLNLSRTSRVFRNRLGTSDLYWKAARENAGMPELEAKDITERQYITLVFDKHCHSCYQPNVQQINYVNCARLCSACREMTRITAAQLRKLLASYHSQLLVCAKFTSDSGSRIPRGAKKLSSKLRDMRPNDIPPYVEQRRILKEQISRDAESIEKWIGERADARYLQEEAAKQSRRASIKQELLAMGWTDETLGSWYYFGFVNQPRKLTEQIWKKIKDPLVHKLREELIRRQNDARRQALGFHYRELMKKDSSASLFPSWAKFHELPPVKAVWNKEIGEPPPELQDFRRFVPEEWEAALPDVRSAIARYQTEMTELAIRRLAAAYEAKGLVVPSNPIADARSVFRFHPPPVRNFDYEDEEDIVAPFPEIHRRMRDRQDGHFIQQGGNEPRAAEFGGLTGTYDGRIMVELGESGVHSSMIDV